MIENVSEHGAKLRIDENLDLPRHFNLIFAPFPAKPEDRPVELKWRVGTAAGVFFKLPTQDDPFALRRLD